MQVYLGRLGLPGAAKNARNRLQAAEAGPGLQRSQDRENPSVGTRLFLLVSTMERSAGRRALVVNAGVLD